MRRDNPCLADSIYRIDPTERMVVVLSELKLTTDNHQIDG